MGAVPAGPHRSPGAPVLKTTPAPFALLALLALAPGRAVAQAGAASPAPRATDPRPTIAAGQVQVYAFAATAHGVARSIWVYTPPGYDAARAEPYDLVVAFDGGDYLVDIPLPLILDTLLAARAVRPMVAVLIENFSGAQRLAELANHPAFVTYLGDDIMPWVRQHWHVTRDPHRTILTGSSAGGLAAAYAALQRPDLFGAVLSQSGAFWRGPAGSNSSPWEWVTSQYRASPRVALRFFLDVGALETRPTVGVGPPILDCNRRLRDVLRAKGYDVTYTEVPDGQHAPPWWRQRLPVGLVTLAGAATP